MDVGVLLVWVLRIVIVVMSMIVAVAVGVMVEVHIKIGPSIITMGMIMI